jgi:hypothetical protein
MEKKELEEAMPGWDLSRKPLRDEQVAHPVSTVFFREKIIFLESMAFGAPCACQPGCKAHPPWNSDTETQQKLNSLGSAVNWGHG